MLLPTRESLRTARSKSSVSRELGVKDDHVRVHGLDPLELGPDRSAGPTPRVGRASRRIPRGPRCRSLAASIRGGLTDAPPNGMPLSNLTGCPSQQARSQQRNSRRWWPAGSKPPCGARSARSFRI